MASSKETYATDADVATTTPTVVALCKKALEVVYDVINYLNLQQTHRDICMSGLSSTSDDVVPHVKSDGKRPATSACEGGASKRGRTDILPKTSSAESTVSALTSDEIDQLYMHPDRVWNKKSSTDVFFRDEDVPQNLKKRMYLMQKFKRHMIKRDTKQSELVNAMLWRGVRRHDESFLRFQMFLFIEDGKDGKEMLPHWFTSEELNSLEDEIMKAKIVKDDIKAWMFFDNTATDVSGTQPISGTQHDDDEEVIVEDIMPIVGPSRNVLSSGDAACDAEVAAKTAALMDQLNAMGGLKEPEADP